MAKRIIPFVIGVLALSGNFAKPQPPGRIIKEVWEAAFLEGSQAGTIHTVFQEVSLAGRKAIEATTQYDLTVNRFGQALKQQFILGNHESDDGKVLTVLMKQEFSKDGGLLITGRVQGDRLLATVQVGKNSPMDKPIPWDARAVGLWGQENLFRNRKLEPNTKFDYRNYEPTFHSILPMFVEIKDWEEVPLLKGEKRRLLRTEQRHDKIEGIQFPTLVLWVDDKGEVHKSQSELLSMKMETYRTTKETALARATTPRVDIGSSQLLKVNRSLPRWNDTKAITYRVTFRGVEDAKTTFANDDRQAVRSLGDDQLEITVRGLLRPSAKGMDNDPPSEFLRNNHFIRSDDDKVKDLSRRAVGDEKDAWAKAVKIERWVFQNISKKTFTEVFATADQAARSLEGDCTEHAMLAAAMCRAVGVPSRIAVGLVHVPNQRAMGFHMWMEVWVGGKWYALDPTLGHGHVGAAHLKISDSHWNDVQSVTPLLSVVRVLGKMKIDITSVQYE